MKNLRNSVQLIGHLGKMPEVTNLEKGKKVARISLATHENYYSSKGEKVVNTIWQPCCMEHKIRLCREISKQGTRDTCTWTYFY